MTHKEQTSKRKIVFIYNLKRFTLRMKNFFININKDKKSDNYLNRD